MKKRLVFTEVLKRAEEPRKFIQVLLGPRQVGKTTLAMQVAQKLDKPHHFISADLATLQDLTWIQEEWEIARSKVDSRKGALLIIDEVHKIPHWSSMIKKLWDEDTRRGVNLCVMILGSSPWLMLKGLSESLAGRFESIPITHWDFSEMHEHFGWTLDQYLYFGGYPGAASLMDERDSSRWMRYINDALVETTISRDILLMTQVNKPALLRRWFQFSCSYSGQVLSFSKMLGELHDAGNTTTLAHYLELLAGTWLVTGIQKYVPQKLRQKASSPKLCVLNMALMSAEAGKTFREAQQDRVYWGRLVESAVGAHLLNSARKNPKLQIFYWREGDKEVDYVVRYGNALIALEVKSNHQTMKSTAIDAFVRKFRPTKVLLVGEKGIPLERFLRANLLDFVAPV